MKTIKTFVLLTVALALFSGCQKDEGGDGSPGEVGMQDLQIADEFNFENTRTIELEVTLPSTVNYPGTHKRVDIYSASPQQGGKLLHTIGSADNGKASANFRIAAHLDSIFIHSFAGSGYAQIPQQNLKNGGIIKFDYNDNYDLNPPSEPDEKKLKSEGKNSLKIGGGLKSTDVINLLGNASFDQFDFEQRPVYSSPMSVNEKWYITDHIKNSISHEAEGGRTFLRVNGGNNVWGGVAQMINAEAGDVVTFSSDIRALNATSSYFHKIWLYLIPRNSAGNALAYNSVVEGSPSSQWHSKSISASMPAGTETCQVLYWIWANTGNVKMDIDNAVASGPVQDSDGDGVDDEEDEYVNNAEKAFNVYYPAENEFGSLGFEDNWPGQGDYDFNDLVIDYHYKQVLNSQNELVEMDARYAVKAIGASFENGFGVELGASPSDIQQVTGIEVPGTYTTLNGNNTESQQTQASIVVFENAFDILPHPGGGLGVNTQEDAPYREPDTLNVKVEMKNPVSTQIVGMAPYNPFLIVDGMRDREVHLPGDEPTDLADPNYFGTMEDDSQPSTNRYYKTANNLPWAIDIPAPYQYPIEKTAIIDAYTHFVEWAESGGQQYDDWYLDKEGYRNNDNIYQQP